MNILITGATGFVGRNLITKLKREHKIFILVRPKSNYSELGISNVYVFNDDIEDLADYIKSNKIDGIIHLASLYLAQHKPEQIKDLVLSNIYFGTVLLEACSIAGVKWFLNTGTIWQNYMVKDYSDEYNPVNLYAASKQAFITMAKYYTETTNLKFCTLKLCDTYGPNDTRKKIFSLFEHIAETGEELYMSEGKQKLDIVHIDKVVDEFEKLTTYLNNEDILPKLRDEYVVTSGTQISLRELAEKFEKEHNANLNIIWSGREYRKREVMVPYKGYEIPQF